MSRSNHAPVKERRQITLGIGGADDDHLRQLAAACPECGRVPAHRITSLTRKLFLALDEDFYAGTIQCQGPRCRTIYDLSARAYQHAR